MEGRHEISGRPRLLEADVFRTQLPNTVARVLLHRKIAFWRRDRTPYPTSEAFRAPRSTRLRKRSNLELPGASAYPDRRATFSDIVSGNGLINALFSTFRLSSVIRLLAARLRQSMAAPRYRTTNCRLNRGLFVGLSFAFALGAFEPAVAGHTDCPATKASFAVGDVRPIDLTGVSGRSLRILAIGSSSTEGVGASSPQFAYPAQLQAHLRRLLGRPINVDNAGVGGETIMTTVKRLEAALSADKPDLVIWQVGTNDALTGEDEARFRSKLVEGVVAMLAAKVPFVLLDPQFFPGARDVAHYERYVRIIHDVGAENGAAVFSRYALMKEWAAHPMDCCELCSRRFLPHERSRL